MRASRLVGHAASWTRVLRNCLELSGLLSNGIKRPSPTDPVSSMQFPSDSGWSALTLTSR
jgi:hypothetical protein